MSNDDNTTWYDDLTSRPRIMGIINVTPDSFSDGGRFLSPDAAYDHAMRLIDEGADLLDIGGESTRPGAEPVATDEELRRTIPVVERLRRRTAIPLSIDTYKAVVAQAALESGASLVNDVSGTTFDPDMAEMVARYDAGLVVMHIQGTPRTMQTEPRYDDVVVEVRDWLARMAARSAAAGVTKIIVDPGLGFGKTPEHNFKLLKHVDTLAALGYPVMIGSSRKSFLGRPFEAPPDDRLEGTLVSNILAVQKGAAILRVHDVKAMRRAMAIASHIAGA